MHTNDTQKVRATFWRKDNKQTRQGKQCDDVCGVECARQQHSQKIKKTYESVILLY